MGDRYIGIDFDRIKAQTAMDGLYIRNITGHVN